MTDRRGDARGDGAALAGGRATRGAPPALAPSAAPARHPAVVPAPSRGPLSPAPSPDGGAGAAFGADRLVVLGASWGGLHAVSTILAALPDALEAPVIVVQHRARTGDGLLPGLLQATTRRRVADVEDKEPIVPGAVHVAPADYHLLVEDGHFSLSTDPVVRYSRPSIDVTLSTAADAYGARVIGVVLTGANDDGARGLRRVLARGGSAVVQDPATAEVRTMPEAALRALADGPRTRWEVAPLDEVARAVAARARRTLDGAVA